MKLSNSVEIISNLFSPYKEFVDEIIIQEIINRSDILTVKKGDYLLNVGQKDEHLKLLLKGCVQIYHVDSEEKQQTSWILSENDIVISVLSFLENIPSCEAIQALEDCTMLYLSKIDLDYIYHTHPKFNYVGRKVIERYYIESEEKANNLRNLSAQNRYFKFCEQKPNLLNRVPVAIVASYLGMPESILSRIQKNI